AHGYGGGEGGVCGRLALDEPGIRPGGAAHGLGGVVDEDVQRAAGGDLVGQRHHLGGVAQVHADHVHAVGPLGVVVHRGEPARGVAGEAGGDGDVGAGAQQHEGDVHADLRAAAGEQGPPAGQIHLRIPPGPVERRTPGTQLVVEGVDL